MFEAAVCSVPSAVSTRAFPHAPVTGAIRLAEVLGRTSYALDITEGQPVGHAARSCLIGMHIAAEIGLDANDRSALFYALLLKDAGCSSNAAKMAYLFGADDQTVKHDVKTIDWQKAGENLRFIREHVAPAGTGNHRLLKTAALLLQGPRRKKARRNSLRARGGHCRVGSAFRRRLRWQFAISMNIGTARGIRPA